MMRSMDTQWARFEVFVQEKPGDPHRDAGSVHASDAEMALLNARDVFARRPEAVSMWVTPAAAIYSRTAEELAGASAESNDAYAAADAEDEPVEEYYVFCKERSAGTQTLVGSFAAASPAQAMAAAQQLFEGKDRPFAWWVLRAAAVTRSDPEQRDSFFAPALDKPFRLSTDFHTHTQMRRVKDA